MGIGTGALGMDTLIDGDTILGIDRRSRMQVDLWIVVCVGLSALWVGFLLGMWVESR